MFFLFFFFFFFFFLFLFCSAFLICICKLMFILFIYVLRIFLILLYGSIFFLFFHFRVRDDIERLHLISFKVKLSPKCNLGSICECIWVKPSCKSIITKKEALFKISHSFVFSGELIFNGSTVKTVRRLDTTWNFARSITRVSTHEHQHWEHCLCARSSLKRRFLNNSH